MLKVKVMVPGAVLPGPGLDGLGLALSVYNTVELSRREPQAEQTQPEIVVEGDSAYDANAYHPAMKAAKALFEKAKDNPAAIRMVCRGAIPATLGDNTAWVIGGLVAANNLREKPLRKEQIIEMACKLSDQPAMVVAAEMGGLAIAASPTLYRRVDVPIMRITAVLPTLQNYQVKPAKPSAAHGAKTALLAEALRNGDHALLQSVFEALVPDPKHKALISGYDQAVAAAKQAGAIAATLSGDGPMIIAFLPPAASGRAAANDTKIKDVEAAIQTALRTAGVESRCWTFNVDTRGITLSVQQ